VSDDAGGYIEKLPNILWFNILTVFTLGWNIVRTYDAILNGIDRMKTMVPSDHYVKINFNTKFVCFCNASLILVLIGFLSTVYLNYHVSESEAWTLLTPYFYGFLISEILVLISFFYSNVKKKKIASVLISIATSLDRDDIAYMLSQKRTKSDILFRAFNFLTDEYNVHLDENRENWKNPFKNHMLKRI